MKIFYIFDRFTLKEDEFYGGTNIRIKELLVPLKEIYFIKLGFKNESNLKNNVIKIKTKSSLRYNNYQDYINCSSHELILRKIEFLDGVYEFLKKESKISVIHFTGETFNLIPKLYKAGFKKIVYTYNIINTLQYFSPVFYKSHNQFISIENKLKRMFLRLFKSLSNFIKLLVLFYKLNISFLLPLLIRFPLLSDIYPAIYCKNVIFVSKNSMNKFNFLFRINKAKKRVILNGISDVFLKNIVFKRNKQIIFVGRIHPIKGVDIFLRAIHYLELKGYLENYEINICGNIDKSQLRYYNYLIYLQKKIKKNKINFLGLISQSKLISLYQKSSLFVSSSLDEPFGMNIIEAIATKNYVICSKTEGSKEISKFTELHFFKKKSFMSLVKEIKLFLKIGDTNLQKEVSLNVNRVKLFNWNNSQKQLLELYDSL